MQLRHLALATATALLAVTAGCGGDSTAVSSGDEVATVSVTIDGVGEVTTDADLARKVPGDIKATVSQQPFDGLVPGLQAAKYDAIAGGITDKKERQQVATFVDYSASGTGFLVKTGNPLAVKTVADLCGRKVAVQKASNQAKNLANYGRSDCAGRAIEVKEYPENPQAVQALIAGNVDVVAATKVNLVDIAPSLTGTADLVEDPSAANGWLASPNGFGFLKAQKELAEAYRAAVQSLIDDGTYTRILTRWKQEPIAIKTATIDQAID